MSLADNSRRLRLRSTARREPSSLGPTVSGSPPISTVTATPSGTRQSTLATTVRGVGTLWRPRGHRVTVPCDSVYRCDATCAALLPPARAASGPGVCLCVQSYRGRQWRAGPSSTRRLWTPRLRVGEKYILLLSSQPRPSGGVRWHALAQPASEKTAKALSELACAGLS